MKSKFKEFTLRVLIAVPLLLAGYMVFHTGFVWWALFCTVIFIGGISVEVFWRMQTSVMDPGAEAHCRGIIASAVVGGLAMIALYADKMGRGFILLGAIMVVCFDSFSLLAGWLQPKSWKKPIAPKESPKKTWGGFIGGTLLSWTAGVIVIGKIESNYVVFAVNRPQLYASMALLPFVAYFGDINESMAKRRLLEEISINRHRHEKRALKDMSHILGPHGGLSDRFDALMAVYSTIGVVWLVMVYS